MICYRTLVFGRLCLHDPLPRNNLELFHGPKINTANKNKLKISDVKHDPNIFCKMYVASQSREGDLEDFFVHENNSYPPSISEFGKMCKASTKSDILVCSEEYISNAQQSSIPNSHECALIIEGAALVHML